MSEYRMFPEMSPEAEEARIEAYRRMSWGQKFEIIDELNRREEDLMRAEILEAHPEATGHEMRLRVAACKYGREFTIQWFGWDPDDPDAVLPPDEPLP